MVVSPKESPKVVGLRKETDPCQAPPTAARRPGGPTRMRQLPTA
jgi:hypothetical protein